jgi:hypothetical protein
MTEKADQQTPAIRRRIQMIFKIPTQVSTLASSPHTCGALHLGSARSLRNSETRIQELLRLVGLDLADAATPHEFSEDSASGSRSPAQLQPNQRSPSATAHLRSMSAGQILNPCWSQFPGSRFTHQPQPGGAPHGKRHWLLSGTAGRVGATQRAVDRPRHLYTQCCSTLPDLGAAAAPPIEGEANQSTPAAHSIHGADTGMSANSKSRCPCKCLIAR